MDRRALIRLMGGTAVAAAATGIPRSARASSGPAIPIFTLRNPGCMCCEGWADHLREHGFEVHLHDSPDLQAVKGRLGIPEDLAGCHTAMVEGYIVEGHVPAEFVHRMLEEKPQVAGIAVAGMPVGSPGMEGPNPRPFDIVAFSGPSAEERYVFGTVAPE